MRPPRIRTGAAVSPMVPSRINNQATKASILSAVAVRDSIAALTVSAKLLRASVAGKYDHDARCNEAPHRPLHTKVAHVAQGHRRAGSARSRNPVLDPPLTSASCCY
jgi:hypothetical protein